jgi:hypothetical protein
MEKETKIILVGVVLLFIGLIMMSIFFSTSNFIPQKDRGMPLTKPSISTLEQDPLVDNIGRMTSLVVALTGLVTAIAGLVKVFKSKE